MLPQYFNDFSSSYVSLMGKESMHYYMYAGVVGVLWVARLIRVNGDRVIAANVMLLMSTLLFFAVSLQLGGAYGSMSDSYYVLGCILGAFPLLTAVVVSVLDKHLYR